MNAQWSTGFAQIYVANPKSLVVQCWVCTTFSSPDTISQAEPHVYHYTKFFKSAVGYRPLGLPCTVYMTAISFVNPAC